MKEVMESVPTHFAVLSRKDAYFFLKISKKKSSESSVLKLQRKFALDKVFRSKVLTQLAKTQETVTSKLVTEVSAPEKAKTSEKGRVAEGVPQNDEYFTINVERAVEVPFNPTVWNKCRATQKLRTFVDERWRNEVIQGLKKVNAVCTFAFKRHSVTLRFANTSKGVLLKCNGYCTFSTCTVMFSCHVDQHLQMHATFTGSVKHLKSEKASRYVQRGDRDSMKAILKHKLPRLHHLEQLKTLDDETRESGCRDNCPSKGVLNQIRYESRQVKTPDENMWLALQKIKEQQQTAPSSATIQSILMDPPGVIFYSVRSIRILHRISKNDIVYVDATGSILLGQQHCYVYEVVVRHPIKHNPPLAVASLITWSHNIPTISYFLNKIWNAQRKLFSTKSFPHLVMCDGSMALINSIIISFFKDSLEGYFRKCWEIVLGKRTSSFVNEPFLHLCASHFMKNAKNLVRKTFKKHFRFGMHVIGAMLICHSISTMKEIFFNLTVLCNTTCERKAKQSFDFLNGFIEAEEPVFEERKEDDHCEVFADCTKSEVGKCFQKVLSEAKVCAQSSSKSSENSYFAPDFTNCLVRTCMPSVLLWSSIMLGDLGRFGSGEPYVQYSRFYEKKLQQPCQTFAKDNRTQGVMEKSQQELKRTRLEERKFKDLAAFSLQYEEHNEALLTEFDDGFRNTTFKRKNKQDPDIAIEKWSKRRRREGPNKKIGVYLQKSKTPIGFKYKQENKYDDNKQRLQTCSEEDPPKVISRLLDTLATRVIAAVRDKGQRILRMYSLKTLSGTEWLDGEVMDYCLHMLADTAKIKTYVVESFVMSSILDEHHDFANHNIPRTVNLGQYEALVGAYHRNRHWRLLFIHAASMSLYLVNPFGSEIHETEKATTTWRRFMLLRQCGKRLRDVQAKTIDHSTQKDGYNCGIICIKLASEFLTRLPQPPTSTSFCTEAATLLKYRTTMEKDILASSEDLYRGCSYCGAKSIRQPQRWIGCDKCPRWYHHDCLQMGEKEWKEAKKSKWGCPLCG